jgi:hypothetical protein
MIGNVNYPINDIVALENNVIECRSGDFLQPWLYPTGK